MTEAEQQIKSFWDSEPCGTTHVDLPLGSKEYFVAFDAYFRDLYPYLEPFLDLPSLKGKTVLVIGLGSGFELQQVAEHAARTIALDLSSETIKLCEKRKDYFEIKFDSINASAREIPLGDESVDIVVSIGCIHHIPGIEQVVSEIHRVLKPGGQFRGMVYNKNSWRYRVVFPFFSGFIYPNLKNKTTQEKINIAYDGSANPYGMVYSKTEVRTLFSQFDNFYFEVNNFVGDELFKIGRYVPRNFLLKTVGRLMGLDLYFKARRA